MGCCRFVSHNHLFCSIRWFSIALSFTPLLYNYYAVDKGVDELSENAILL